MPSTYTTNGGIELIATGEQSGTWGSTTNTNLQIVDRLTNGVGAITLSGTTHTLTTSDGTLSDGQYAVLVFGGSPSGTNTVTISPNGSQHVYFVQNSSGQSVVLTQGSGGNVTVANGKSAIVYADGAGAGAAVIDVTSTFDFGSGSVTSVSGTGTVNGISLSGTVTSSGDLTLGGTLAISDADWSGTDLSVANGGTGASSFTANTVLLGNGTSSFQTVAPSTTGNVLRSNGTTWQSSALATTDISGVTASSTELNYLDITTLGTSQASKAVTADANGNIKLTEEVQAVCYLETAISVPSTTIDCDEGNVFYKTISADTTFTFSYAGVNLTTDDAYAFTLILTVSGTRTVTWPASVDWAGGTAPDAPASGETDVYVFVTRDGGTTWYGFQAGDAMS